MHFKKLYFTTGFFFCFLTSIPLFGMDHWFSDEELDLIEEIQDMTLKAKKETVVQDWTGRQQNGLQKLISDLDDPELQVRIDVACSASQSDDSPRNPTPDHTSPGRLSREDEYSYKENSNYAKLTCKVGKLLSASKQSPIQIQEIKNILTDGPIHAKIRKFERLARKAEGLYIDEEVDFSKELEKLKKTSRGWAHRPYYFLTGLENFDDFSQLKAELKNKCQYGTKALKMDINNTPYAIAKTKRACQSARLLTIAGHPDEIKKIGLKEIAKKRLEEIFDVIGYRKNPPNPDTDFIEAAN